LEKALREAGVGITEKYIWLGNLVAPAVAEAVATSFKRQMLTLRIVASRPQASNMRLSCGVP
jgi:hypothetical protein